ncbi:MAG TPA: hypothetical protein VK524_06570 [Polyangiaceae bacterium]|nr:hypothetical protein [Polyangiaceae bacterium]
MAVRHKEIFGVVSRGEQGFWTRIGTAFENRDGSWNIKLDFVPTDPQATIQMRDPRPRDDESIVAGAAPDAPRVAELTR